MSLSTLHRRLPFVSVSPPAPLAPNRALRESLPLAGLLLFWTLLSWAAFEPFVSWAVRTTGAVTTLGYVLVRGITLGDEATALVTGDAASVLGQQVRLAPAPALWFVAGVGVPVLEGLWEFFGLFGLFVSPATDLVRVCALTGLATALLLVVSGTAAALGDG